MNRLGTFLIVAFLSFVLTSPASLAKADPGSSTLQGQSQVFQKTIADVRAQIRQWEMSADIQVSLVVMVGLFGVLIPAFHRSSNKWAKLAVLIMGLATSAATVISSSNAVFTADYRALRQAVSQGNLVVARMDGIAATPNLSSMSADAFAVIQQQMDTQLDKFDKIAQQAEASRGSNAPESTRNSPSGLWELPAVQAQGTTSAPSWLSRLPPDSLNLYFVGINTDTSLVKARSSSLKDAGNKLAQAFELDPPYVSTDSRKALINSSYTIQDTYLRSDPGSSAFTFYTLLRISRNLQRMQASALEYKQNGWHPADLTYDPVAGLLVLDHDGRVFHVNVDEAGIHLQQLFQLPLSSRPAAIAANQDSIFVSSNSQTGCNIYQYSLPSGRLSQRNVGSGQGGCDGIATNGAGLFLAVPARQAIEYWPNWNSSSLETFGLPESVPNCVLKFDVFGQRLIYAGPTGDSYALSLATGKWSSLAKGLGFVNSIDASTGHLLFASGNRVLFCARSNNAGENPPPGMQSIDGSLTSGVAVDSSNAAWITDYNNSSIRGPFPLD